MMRGRTYLIIKMVGNNFGSRETKITNYCNKEKRVYNFLKDNHNYSFTKNSIAEECGISYFNELLNIIAQLKYFKLIEETKDTNGTPKYKFNSRLFYI